MANPIEEIIRTSGKGDPRLGGIFFPTGLEKFVTQATSTNGRRLLFSCLLLPLFSLLTGCCTHVCWRPDNVVIVNSDGKLCDPRNGDPFPTQEAQNKFFHGLTNRIATNAILTNIVVFIQGGLCDINTGIDSANSLSQLIEHEGSYPIFVAWDASLYSSYWDHLAKVHRGKTDRLTAGFLFPWTIIADAGRLVSESPIAFFEQFDSSGIIMGKDRAFHRRTRYECDSWRSCGSRGRRT